MGELRLFAIGVDEVRDLFGASEATGQAFRAVATSTFPPPHLATPGLLSKLGPLFRRPPDAPVVRPDVPTEAEVSAILQGRFVPPERLEAAWRLVEAWLEAMSWGSHRVVLTEAEFNDLEFDLARAGMAPQYGLVKVVNRELGIPLRPARGLASGYVKNAHVEAARDAWREAVPALSERNRGIAEAFLAFLDRFPEFEGAAPTQGRPVPDLVGVYRSLVTSAAGS